MVRLDKYQGQPLDKWVAEHPDHILVLFLVEPGCKYCQSFVQALPEIQKRLDILSMIFLEIDIHEHPEFARNYAITGTPTFVFIAEGVTQVRFEGFMNTNSFVSQVISDFLSC